VGQICTPASLAASLSGQEKCQASSSIPPYLTILQSGNLSCIYVLIAPGGGSCGSYIDLSQHLPTSATIVTLEHPNFSRPGSETYSVRDLSELYACDLKRSFDTMRECVLVGASFGGIVAFELSQTLLQSGILVKSISLVDSPWPGSDSTVQALSGSAFLRNVFGVIADPDLPPPADSGDYFFGEINMHSSISHSSEVERLTSAVSSALSGVPSQEKEKIEKYNWRGLLAVYVENVLALLGHSIDNSLRLDVPALYVKATRSCTVDCSPQWAAVLPRLSVTEIEAEHALSYTGKNGGEVARLISELSV
jgi:pimeloyl-ACP methyl ester carboxylesterase